MNNKEFTYLLEQVIIPSVHATRQSGGEEYARDGENIFANFERVSDSLEISVEECIMVYSLKHIDGIIAHVQGTTSQREDVRGRITDLIVYMSLLWAYIVKDDSDFNEMKNDLEGNKKTLDLESLKIPVPKDIQERIANAPPIQDFKWEKNSTDVPEWDGDLSKGIPDNVMVHTAKANTNKQPVNSDGSSKCCGGNKKSKKEQKK